MLPEFPDKTPANLRLRKTDAITGAINDHRGMDFVGWPAMLNSHFQRSHTRTKRSNLTFYRGSGYSIFVEYDTFRDRAICAVFLMIGWV